MTVLDTSTILYFLTGRLDEELSESDYQVSVIAEMELLSYPGLKVHEAESIKDFLKAVTLVDLTAEVKQEAIRLRKEHKLKLPDAIIAATAMTSDATLLTQDKKLAKTPGLDGRVPMVKRPL